MLSKKSKYAIHALVFLAQQQEQSPVQIQIIAKAHQMPRKFLESILLDLKNNGLLISRKGRFGGYLLARKPETINLAEVIRIFDGALAHLPCVTHKYYERCDECLDENLCGVRDVFLQLRNETVEMLKKATLAEIMHREHQLSKPKS
jgi:Rrf2 family protein